MPKNKIKGLFHNYPPKQAAEGRLKSFSPVTAAKWLSPHLILVTATEGLNSDRPNSVDGIISGVDDSDSLGPFPRIPYPQTNTSPLSDRQTVAFSFQMLKFMPDCMSRSPLSPFKEEN